MRQKVVLDKSTPFQGALNFSYLLDAPAGKHGHVQIKDGHFFFENGKRIRFIGFNFPARANMPDHKTAEALAARLTTMGVNVVRVHAADAYVGEKGWSTDPEYSILDYAGKTGRLNEKGMERLDYWLYQLKKHGIYLHIDLLVARKFLESEGLDYPENLSMSKSSSHFNERLIELQEQYARQYLTHVNRYTGLSLAEDPAVMTIQICNEDSVFFDSKLGRKDPAVSAYKRELQQRFNYFLLAKYGNKKNLKKAWTYRKHAEIVSDLGKDEDPAVGSVRCPEVGNYCQNVNDPLYEVWQETRLESPGRYADFTQFEIEINRNYYQRMIHLLRSIPVKAPIATGCLLAGAADIYSHLDGDVMENNSYFNHPMGNNDSYDGILVQDLRDYVSTDPLTQTFPEMEHRSNITVQASISAVEKRPMILSEWNEYGLQLFHSPAYLMTTAYACLNDWDGLIVYCYHTDDHLRPEAADKVLDVMDCYSDPSLMLQFGILSAIFQKGLIKASFSSASLVYRTEELLRLPYTYRMPTAYFPLIMQFRSIFLGTGEQYCGTAQVAVSAGFLAGGDYSNAEHAIVYNHSEDLDAFGKYKVSAYRSEEGCHQDACNVLEFDGERYSGEAELDEKCLNIRQIDRLTVGNDYSVFAGLADKALKKWGILAQTSGLQKNGDIISQTEELFFNPSLGTFRVDASEFKAYVGRIDGTIRLMDNIFIKGNNRSLFIGALSLDSQPLTSSRHYLLTIFGETGLDQTTYHPVDFRTTEVRRKGERFVEILDGTVEIHHLQKQRVRALGILGQVQKILAESETECDTCFRMCSPCIEVMPF